MIQYLILILFISQTIIAKTIILQNGLEDYTETEDLTIFSHTYARHYTLHLYEGSKNDTNDTLLVNAEFCC